MPAAAMTQGLVHFQALLLREAGQKMGKNKSTQSGTPPARFASHHLSSASAWSARKTDLL